MKLACANCGQKFLTTYQYSGKAIKCATCAGMIQLPAIHRFFAWNIMTGRAVVLGTVCVVAIAVVVVQYAKVLLSFADSVLKVALVLFAAGIVLVVYFLPSFIANGRNHRNTEAIVILNLFTGWTVGGWVASMIWAVIRSRDDDRRAAAEAKARAIQHVVRQEAKPAPPKTGEVHTQYDGS